MDETPVQVLKEPGKSAQSKSWIWVSRGGPPPQPLVLYDYDPGRGKAVPLKLPEDYNGYLQTDGYKAYREVVSKNDLTHVGCWAHARRKFDEANKAQGRGEKPAGRAMQGLAYIQKLYRIERALKETTSEERYTARQEQAAPVLEQLRTWLDKSLSQVPPQSAVGKALNYLHEEWPRLIRYMDDGLIPIDNNLTEDAIRPFTIGRKNWLFSDSVKGIESGTNLYSLIHTAKANHLEPYQYLRHVFTELPKADYVEAIEALLPANIDVDTIYC
jgi:transposase